MFERFMGDIAAVLNKYSTEYGGYVQGVLLDYHSVWRDIQRLRGYGDQFVRQYFAEHPANRKFTEEILSARFEYDEPDGLEGIDEVRESRDILPSEWNSYADQYGKKIPLLATIRVLPTTSATLPIRRELMAMTANHPFFAIVEDRSEASLAASVQGGVDLKVSFPGTLGGFLSDGTTRYGLTCGHVATNPGDPVDVDDVGAMRLVGAGKVYDTNFPGLIGQPIAQFCNPFGGTNLPEVDAALITLDPPHLALNTVYRIGKISLVKKKRGLSPGQTVTMMGSVSGANDYEVGPLAVTYRFHHNGKYYCFKNLFMLKGKLPSWTFMLDPRIARPVAPRPRPGDSGAWICALEGTGSGAREFSFCGTLTGVDGDDGYATFADSFTDLWRQLNLRPFLP
jgi:hypothetical protein